MPTVKKATKKPIKKEIVKEAVQETCKEEMKKNLFKHHKKTDCGCFYFLWVIWAAIYFIWQATTFRVGVVALLKALVRPVFLVHWLLKFLWL